MRNDPELETLLSEYADNIDIITSTLKHTSLSFYAHGQEITTYKYKRHVLTANAVIPSLLESIKQVLFSAFILGPSSSWIVI